MAQCLARVKAQGTALKDTVQPPQLQEELLLIVLALLVNTVLLKSSATAGAAGRDIDVPQVHCLGKRFKEKMLCICKN